MSRSVWRPIIIMAVVMGPVACSSTPTSAPVTTTTTTATAFAAPTSSTTTTAPTTTVTTATTSSTTAASTASTLSPASTLPKGACATGQLSVSIGGGQGEAGTLHEVIIFTNISQQRCSITGFPGVSLVDAGRNQIGEPTGSPAGMPPPAAVNLDAGATASALFSMTDPGVLNCTHTTSTSMRVYPPGNTDPLFVAFAGPACTSGDPLGIGPVVSGSTAGL